jgi:hypothetical protein
MNELNPSFGSENDRHALWSRRHLLLAGLAGASAAAVPGAIGMGAVPGLSGTRADAALPTVRPISSQAAYSAFGICALPHLGNSPYRYTTQWMEALSKTGASYFRGMYAHNISATANATRAARTYGIQWGMTVCPNLDFPNAELVARIRHIAANAADRCLFVEGINEPNYNRGSGTIPTDWARRAVAKQKIIWDTVKSDSRLNHVKVLGPKLQASVGTESHYRALGAAGIARYMDFATLACYPGGKYPYHVLNQRLSWIKAYWGGKPAWITETGYTNALASTRGHAVTPEDVSAAYAPSILLEAIERGCKVSMFELLDSPDAGAKDDTEDNFGMFGVGSGDAPPWRAKPIVTSLRSFLSSLKDPGPAYTPSGIQLSVTSAVGDVRHTVTAKRNGSATVHVRRAKDAWDPDRKVRLSVPEVAVRITTPRGSRTVMVDHRVRSFAL